MTPASWLRTSSTRRPYSNMFSEMSGGKSMNIHPHKNRKLIYTDGNFHVVYATSRALRSNTKGTAFKTSRHPKRSKRHPTSLLRKSRSHMLRSFNHSYTKGLSHHSPGMSWPIQTRSPDILFFDSPAGILQILIPWILSGDFTLCWTWWFFSSNQTSSWRTIKPLAIFGKWSPFSILLAVSVNFPSAQIEEQS